MGRNPYEYRGPQVVTTVRLPDELAADVALAAKVDGLTFSEFVRRAVADHIKARGADPAFRAHAQERADHDQRILMRLVTADPARSCCCDRTTARLVICPIHIEERP